MKKCNNFFLNKAHCYNSNLYFYRSLPAEISNPNKYTSLFVTFVSPAFTLTIRHLLHFDLPKQPPILRKSNGVCTLITQQIDRLRCFHQFSCVCCDGNTSREKLQPVSFYSTTIALPIISPFLNVLSGQQKNVIPH